MTLEGPPLTTWFFQEKNLLISKVGEVKVTITEGKRILNRVLCQTKEDEDDSDITEELRWTHPLSVLESM